MRIRAVFLLALILSAASFLMALHSANVIQFPVRW